MKKFIISVQAVRNDDNGDPQKSLLNTGVLTAESRWDALKKSRTIAKEVSHAFSCSWEETESYWHHGAGKAIGFCIMKEENGYNSYEYVGVVVTIHELKPAIDGIEWGEIE